MKKFPIFLASSIYFLASAPVTLAAITNTAVPGGGSPDDSPKQFAVTISTLWQTIILVGGLAFLLYFLMGGIQWITAGGEKGKIEDARNHITQGLIGLAVLAASYVIIKFIETAIGLNLLNISWPTAG
jgi:hypothetical protein